MCARYGRACHRPSLNHVAPSRCAWCVRLHQQCEQDADSLELRLTQFGSTLDLHRTLLNMQVYTLYRVIRSENHHFAKEEPDL